MRSCSIPLPRLRRLAALVLPLLLVGCGSIAPPMFGGDVDQLLARGEAYVSRLGASPPEKLGDADVLALGYLERARLGLGSPFRLIDYALHDEALPAEARPLLAYGILSYVLDGRGYEIDPAVLHAVPLSGVAPEQRGGREQLRLVEEVVAAAPSARSGEQAIRLGYRLAEAERTIGGDVRGLTAGVAALVADRREAREDARALLRAAATQGADPLQLLREWRRQLRFSVEEPSLVPLSVRDEAAATEDGIQLALAIRALAQRLSAPRSLVTAPPPAEPASFLRGATAERMDSLARARDYPQQAPVAVAVQVSRDRLLADPGLEPGQRAARERFADSAWNEERLVAGAALLRRQGAAPRGELARLEVKAATYLRAWSQEEPWMPGDPGPAEKDLAARFGLAGVRFGPDVPRAWRPYYLRMLARGLAEMQRVLPAASLRGLTISVASLPDDQRALALHVPRTRTLVFPPATGAGTLAHELAHDLDWQLARRRYAVRGGYATDRAVRTNRRDRIATSFSSLAAALARPGGGATPDAHESRPAEVFARGVDWFAAVALARQGRAGGYLTSFQDPVLTGYGTARGPDVGGGAVPSLISLLTEVAPVPDPTREWALETYGPTRTLSPLELAEAILGAGAGKGADQRFDALARASERALRSLGGTSCRLSSPEGMRRLFASRRQLVQAAAGAAARGTAVDAVRALTRATQDPGAIAHVQDWLAWRLYGAPEPVDSTLAALAPAFEDLLYQADAVERADPSYSVSVFHLAPAPTLCGGNPFARARLHAAPPALGRPLSAPVE